MCLRCQEEAPTKQQERSHVSDAEQPAVTTDADTWCPYPKAAWFGLVGSSKVAVRFPHDEQLGRRLQSVGFEWNRQTRQWTAPITDDLLVGVGGLIASLIATRVNVTVQDALQDTLTTKRRPPEPHDLLLRAIFGPDTEIVPPATARAAADRRRLITAVLDTLQPRERDVIIFRFGLDGTPARTLREIGRQFVLSAERIRQIQTKALRKLRHPSRARRLRSTIRPAP